MPATKQSKGAKVPPIKGVTRRQKTEAQAAREAAGLTLDQFAKRVRLKPKTVGHYERHGVPDYVTAERMSRIVNCKVDLYLHPRAVSGSKQAKTNLLKMQVS